jgi:hypothetical protein
MAIKAKLTTFDSTMVVVSLIIGIFRTPAMLAVAAQVRDLGSRWWNARMVMGRRSPHRDRPETQDPRRRQY